MCRAFKQLSAITVLLTFASMAQAADLDTSFTYQGELQTNGVVSNGEFDFEFELYDAEMSGMSMSAVETIDDVVVMDGLFSVELNFGAMPYAGEQLWLEINVRNGDSSGGYTNLLPRQKVTASPYALHAEMVAIDAIGAAEIADNTVGTAELSDGAVGGNQVNPGQVQLRVADSCASRSAVRRINQDGSVTCNILGGVEFDNSPTSTSVSLIDTCATRTVLKQVTLTIPASNSTSYVVCRASGRTFHSQTAKWVFYSIDNALGTGNDVFAYTGIATTTSTYNNYDPYSMQEVYSIGSAGGTSTYYLKACRQDVATTGTSYHDDFVCEVIPNRY